MGSIKIAPSVLSADMANLKGELDKIAGADYVHFDVMDGHFTGNLTFGVEILKAVKRSTKVPVDAHLMVSNPDETVDWYADAGADMITVHYEASTHLHRTLTHLQQRGVKAGVVLNPATPVCVLESIIEVVDIVLLMSVNPGFSGQSFIPGTLHKLHELKAMCERHGVSPMIEVDGGISSKNIAEVVKAHPQVLFLDEPFSALDAQTKMILQQDLARMLCEQRKTALFITHDLVEAIAMSDRILVMSARPGTIVEEIEVGLPLRDNPLERRKLPEIGPLVGRLMTLLKVGESAELH